MTWQETPSVEVLLTPKQVVEYTGGLLKEATLAWWRHAGDATLPWGRLGAKKIVYRRSDVDRFLASAFAGTKASA